MILFVFIKLLFGLSIILFIGFQVLNICNKLTKNVFKDTFASILTGSITCVLISSIVQAKFMTINVLFFYPIFFLIKSFKIKPNFQFNNFKLFIKIFITTSAISVPFYLIEVLYLFDLSSLELKTIHYDYIFYAEVSESIFETGNENNFRTVNTFFNEDFKFLTPYHYFELWLNGFLARLCNTPYILNLMLITYTILKVGVFSGILSLIKNSNKFYYFFISFLLLAVAPVYFNFYDDFEITKYYSGITQTSILNGWGRKYLGTILVLIAVFKLRFNSDDKTWIYFLLFIPVISVGCFPGVVGGILTYLVIEHYLFEKGSNIIQIIRYSSHVLIFTFAYILIYLIFGNSVYNQELIDKSLLENFVEARVTFSYFKNVIFLITFPALRLLLYTLPFIVPFIIIKKYFINNYNRQIILIASMLISGLIFSSFTKGINDHGQFFYSLIPLLNTLIIFSIVSVFCLKNRKYKLIFIFIILIICSYNVYQNYLFVDRFNNIYKDDYDKNSKVLISEFVGENKNIAFLKDTVLHPISEINKYPLKFLNYNKSSPNIVLINSINKYDTNSVEKGYISYNPFIHFLKISNKRTDENQFEFCKKFNFNLITTRNTELPDIFKKYMVDSLININKSKNENLYKLNFSNI